MIDLGEVLEHFVTVSQRIGLEAFVPCLEFFALLEAALPKTLDHLVGEELDKVLFVRVLSKDVFEELSDGHVFHSITDVCSF